MNKKVIKTARNIINKIYLYSGLRIDYEKCNRKQLKADLRKLKKQALLSEEKFPITKLYPAYKDASAGNHLEFHYFYQDYHLAHRVFVNNPGVHVDIGSRIDGFVAHVASFREIEIYDVRKDSLPFPNMVYKQADVMNPDSIPEQSIESISCLHALEHFGLGRYGDPIMFEGHLLGFKTITQSLKTGGRFYFSVPMGPQRIEFHAHRVFSLKYLVDWVSKDYRIEHFSYVDDKNRFFPHVEITKEALENNFGCTYGCAIFELVKVS